MKKNVGIFLVTIISVQAFSQRTLSLEECRNLALKHNKNIQIAKESVNAARELKKAAFTQFLPNFSANATYTWNQKNLSLLQEDALLPVGSKMPNGSFGFTPDQVKGTTLPNGQWVPLDANNVPFDPTKNPEKIVWKNYAILPKEAMEFDIKHVFAGTIGFVQPIFLGGKIAEMYKMAKFGEELANAQQDNKCSELLQEVDEAYWRIVSLKNKYKLALDYKNLLAKLDTNVRIMTEEGVATKAEQLKVRVKLNEAGITVAKIEDGLQLSKMALNQLCGFEEDNYSLEELNLDSEDSLLIVNPKESANNRPEIKALQQMENIARSNEKLMISRFLPNIALTGNYIVSNPNMFNGYKNEFAGAFNLGIIANVPLFHFGEKVHTLNAATSERKISQLKLDEAKEKIELQIKQNNYKLAESLRKKNAAKQNIDEAIENLKFATEGFDAGVITSTDLLAAQTAWLTAKSEIIDASIDYKLCYTYLSKSIGELNDKSINKQK